MIIKPTRTVLAVIALAVVSIVVAAVIVVVSVVGHRDRVRENPADFRPELSVSTGVHVDRVPPKWGFGSGTGLLRVPPIQFCEDLAAGKCDPVRKPAKAPVEAGQTLSIALPPYIQDRPWSLLVQYYSPATGEQKFRHETHITPGGNSIVLPATTDWLVAAVEIAVPSTVQDQYGDVIAQAKWSLDTLPALPADS